MRSDRIVFPIILAIALSACVSKVDDAEKTRRELVRRDVSRLEEEQFRMITEVDAVTTRLDQLRAEKQKKIEERPGYPGTPVVAKAEVIAMKQNPQAPFRYLGRVRLQSPEQYAGKEVDGYLLSHDRDLGSLAGSTIEIATHSGILEQQLEPLGPFSISKGSTLAARDRAGRFELFEASQYSAPVSLSGSIITFAADPENRSGYFIFEMLFSGDVATVLIESPAQYRGAQMRILVEEGGSTSRESWSELGAQVRFSTTEAAVAWEPWGFTRAAELSEVRFSN